MAGRILNRTAQRPIGRERLLRSVRRTLVMVATAVTLTLSLPSALPNARGTAGAETLTLTWSDEFIGPAGSAPDPTKWRHDVGGSASRNKELQYYTKSTKTAVLDGQGNLVITARKEGAGSTCWYGKCKYTSARLTTAGRFSQKYGRFEVRVKIPGGQGLWPAFWMLNDNYFSGVRWPKGGEIDVLENIGRKPSTIVGCVHGPGYSLPASYTLPEGEVFSREYHTFAVEWAPDSLTWYVDGVAYKKRTREDLGNRPWVMNDPYFLILNLAVGGTWPGNPDSSTKFPAPMLVDYVRVYAL